MLAVLTSIGPLCAAELPDLSGTWILNRAESPEFEEMARLRNEELNVERRENTKQKFARGGQSQSANRFQKQADATEKMIREDSRSIEWSGTDELRMILESSTIKLYLGRKVAILYDHEQKRLLTINPAGRAYSVSGTEISTDDIGRTLSFYDKGALVIETSPHIGGKLIEKYELAEDGRQLRQDFTVQERAGGPLLEFQRLFDRSE